MTITIFKDKAKLILIQDDIKTIYLIYTFYLILSKVMELSENHYFFNMDLKLFKLLKPFTAANLCNTDLYFSSYFISQYSLIAL